MTSAARRPPQGPEPLRIFSCPDQRLVNTKIPQDKVAAKAAGEIGTRNASMQTARQDSVAAIKEISGTIERITKIARNDGRTLAIPPAQSRGSGFFLYQKPGSVIRPDQGQL